jgi:ATP-dependent helicase/nuclease subunit A
MTAHGAKGLEAPIVILPDTASDPSKSRSSPLLMLAAGNGDAKVPLWPVPKSFVSPRVQALKDFQKSRDADEKLRLLYVAMTRARDELYICGYKGKNELSANCWYEICRTALTKQMAEIPEQGGWRLGAAPTWRDAEAEAIAAEVAGLPAWASVAFEAAAEAAAPQAPRVRRPKERVARGILIHRILQQLPELEQSARQSYIATAIKRAGADASLADELLERLAHPALAELLAADGLSEVPLIARRPDGNLERRRIDRLVITQSGILIADYKTDRDVPDIPEACNPEYLLQMAAYREALRLIHPGAPIRLCLVWTEAPKLMPLPDTLLDSMAAVKSAGP